MSRRVIGKNAPKEVSTSDFEKKRLSGVFKTIDDLVAPWKPIPTGFENLDKVLNGGIIPQLYVLGAQSSAGKSTFMLNIAEKIAQNKHPVMYYSLEMPSDYIARLMICHKMLEHKRGFDKKLAMRNFTNRIEEIKNGEQKSFFEQAFGDYKKLGEYFYVFERDKQNSGYNAKKIYDEVEEFKKKNKNQSPIVIVDYLQILDGEKDKYISDQRSVVEYNVGYLSQIANELKVPVVAISSISRVAYNGKPRDILLSDFKESGRIEYSADVVWALQTAAIDNNSEIMKRTLKLSILKNRYGEKDVSAWLSFYPEFGLFEKGEKAPEGSETQAEETQVSKAVSKKTENKSAVRKSNDGIALSKVPVKTEKSGNQKNETNENVVPMLNSVIANTLRVNCNNCGVHTKLNLNSRGKKIAYVLRRKDNTNDGAESLTLWDMAVLDAVYAVTDWGRRSTFTISDLHKFMCGKSDVSNRSKQITNKFSEALERLNNREMMIDITEELQMRDKDISKDEKRQNKLGEMLKEYCVSPEERANLPENFINKPDRTIIKGTLLPFEKSENTFRLVDENPILFEYTANLSYQYLNYDPALWEHIADSKKNVTLQRLLIRYYLIHEIRYAKHKWKIGHTHRCVITICPPKDEKDKDKGKDGLLILLALSESSKAGEADGIEKLRDSRWKNDVCKDTEMILNDFKKRGFISDWDTFKGKDKTSKKDDIIAYEVFKS